MKISALKALPRFFGQQLIDAAVVVGVGVASDAGGLAFSKHFQCK